MNNPLDVWPNAWKSLQQMIPGNSRHDEELHERISALEQQVTRLEQESQWRGIELDRRINELNTTIERNAERDRVSTALAQEQGWHVMRVWECEVTGNADAVAKRILGERPRTGP